MRLDLDLAQHLADGDAEDALAAAHEVDDLVVRRAEVDAGAVAHQGGLSEVVDAGLAQLVDRDADLLQRDAGVEQTLDELEDEDVAEAVEALRTGSGRSPHGRLDELRARPVVELAVADAGGASGDRAAVAGAVVEVGQTVGEEQSEIVARLLAAVHVDHGVLTLKLNLKLNFLVFSTLLTETRPGNHIRSDARGVSRELRCQRS